MASYVRIGAFCMIVVIIIYPRHAHVQEGYSSHVVSFGHAL